MARFNCNFTIWIKYGSRLNCNILKNVYYGGADEQWSTISIDSSNSELKTANIYYYSFEQPTSAGNYWHYVEGIPTIWVTE